ncbi:MAG TPA: hypothetical protein VFK26_03550 [Gemmatimonadaceae bacterium]|jgi:hypothetical protein|nr:hypothetical protein [Gemmatimonadaceae bacterium]HJQ52825.1 hypothetical protein [Gemmatimonadaceae bacterium]
MTAPTTSQLRVDRLPRDTFRSILAGLITALTIGGWIDALGKTRMRGALAAQTKLWWIEQIVGVALAIVCIGIIMRKRSFLWPAFWLTVYSLIFDIVRWYFEFRERQIRIPIALVLYALFLWRMWKTRREVSAVEDGAVVTSTG